MKYITGLIAAGSLAVSGHLCAELNHKVFDEEHQSIEKNMCEECELSLSHVFGMIAKRNIRDMNFLRSSADTMTHL
ncbi:MAG: hypothetical protein K940chlam3_01617 [Chlamydiae bacterium]|nr:hypothetical protein [Chlamydiota bacterium]